MPFFKHVYVFTQGRNAWTEVFYQDAASLALSASFTPLFISATLAMRSSLTVLEKIRVSSVDNNRVATPVPLARQGTAASTFGGPDVVSTSAIVLLNAPGKGFQRRLFLRGLPDGFVLRSATTGGDIPAGAFYDALDSWLGAIEGYKYQVRALKRLTGAWPLKYQKISPVTIVANADPEFTTDVAITHVTGDRVILAGFSPKQWPGLNGHWTVSEGGVGSFKVRYKANQAPGTYPQQTAKVRGEVYDYDLVVKQASGFDRFGKRDTGGSFLGGRGRRRGLHLRSL